MNNFSFFDEIPEIKIVDVGASDIGGTQSYQKIIDDGFASLIGFEPNKQACKELNDNNKNSKCKFLPYFIGDGELATFHETNWVATGSLFAPNTRLLDKFQNLSELVTPKLKHQVKTIRLDDIPEIKKIDFLKMDIQGGELSALSNATKLLKSTLVIQTEVEFVELYKDQPLFSDIDKFLRSQGFQFHCFKGVSGRAFKPVICDNDINKMINQQLWSDAIYVKDWMSLESLNEEALITYAILANEVLNSPDLAHLVLQKIDNLKNSNFAVTFLNKLTSSPEK